MLSSNNKDVEKNWDSEFHYKPENGNFDMGLINDPLSEKIPAMVSNNCIKLIIFYYFKYSPLS